VLRCLIGEKWPKSSQLLGRAKLEQPHAGITVRAPRAIATEQSSLRSW
jgi:hypothetical protein